MNTNDSIQTHRPSLIERLWHAPAIKAYMVLAAAAAFAMPAQAHAAGFGELGGKLASVFCDFIKSPIITILVGAGMLGLFILATLNEDNKMLSGTLKVVVAGLAIVFLPGLLSMLGFAQIC